MKGNTEILRYMTEHEVPYLNYLLRPLEKKHIDDLADEGEWGDVESLRMAFNRARVEAMGHVFMQEKGRDYSRLPGLFSTLKVFFTFVEKLEEDGYLI